MKNPIDNPSPAEFHALCEAAIEERLTAEQLRQLESGVLENGEFRRYYIEHVQQHLVLSDWAEEYLAKENRVAAVEMAYGRFPPEAVKRRRILYFGVLSLLIVVAAGVGFYRFASSGSAKHSPEIAGTSHADGNDSLPPEAAPSIAGNPFFASLREKSPCVWEIMTENRENERIGQGRMHLVSGIAQISFDNGVVLSLESPVKLDVLDQSRCYLHSGKVLACVSPEGIGFTIETPVAKIEDLGTEFGVNVQEGKDTEVQVFSGLVDIHSDKSLDTISVHSGGRLQFNGADAMPYNPNEKLPRKYPQQFSLTDTEAMCTTAFGRGKEAFILSGGNLADLNVGLKSDSQIYLLIKNAGSGFSRWHRKAYFAFDISAVPTRSLKDAQIELAFGPTGVGFQSRLQEKTHFVVYGFFDESCDSWDEATLNWNNAPGNLPDAAKVDPGKAVVVGEFDLGRNEQSALMTVSGETLNQLIASDTNDLLTFVVVTETEEPLNMGYAHGFANRNHPELPPPTLRLFFDEITDSQEISQ